MAIVKKTQEDEKEQGGMNVLGQQGMQQAQAPGQAPASQDPIQTSGGPSATIGGQAPGASGQPQQAAAEKKGTPKGSGMFTDIRKYAEANKPQAQAISGAVQKGFQQSAQKVGQQVQQKQQNFQERVAEQRARRQQAQNFAQQQIQAAGTQGQAANEEDLRRFRNIAEGQESFSNVGQLGVAQQDLEARKLARKAALSERATGAKELLRDTFGDQRYTRGQQALDSLILGRDSGARQDVVTAAQEASRGLTGDIREAGQLSRTEAAALSQEDQALREQIEADIAAGQTGVISDLDAQVAASRQALKDNQAAFQKGLLDGTLTEEQLREYISADNLQSELQRQKDALGYSKGAIAAYLGDAATARAAQGKYGDYGELGDIDYWLNRRYGQEYRADKLFGGGVGYAGEGSGFADPARALLSRYGYDQGEVAKYQEEYKKDYVNKLNQERKAEKDAVWQEAVKRYPTDTVNPVYANQWYDQQIKAQGLDKPVQISSNDEAKMYAESIQDLLGKIDVSEEAAYRDLLEGVQGGRGKDIQDMLYKQLDPTKLTRETEITDEQMARQSALAALAGRPDEGLISRQKINRTPGKFNLKGALKKLRTL